MWESISAASTVPGAPRRGPLRPSRSGCRAGCRTARCAAPGCGWRRATPRQPDLQGAFGREAFVEAEQRDAQGLAERDAPGEADRLERGGEPVADVRVEERGVVGAEDDVGLVEPIERAAGRHAVHRAHQGFPHLVELGRQLLARIALAPDVGMAVDALLDVHAGAERTLARGAQHDDVHVVVRLDRPPDVGEVVEHRLVEAVHGVRAVEGDRRDVPGHVVQDGLHGHLSSRRRQNRVQRIT
jgi:hypothetical protein